MRDIPVRAHSPLPAGAFEAAARFLRTHATMADVLDWCRSQSPRADLADVIVQDEFTHDVVLAIGGGLHAVYDST
jgi:hypothetical protein